MNETQRLAEALENAKLAFWASISFSYPEITSGDVYPEHQIYFDTAMENSVKIWLETNKSEANDQK